MVAASANHDVLTEILTNPSLSIEDIVRCSCVCKSWYSLVTSPPFVSLHSTQQRSDSISKKKGLFLVIENHERFSLNLDDDSLSEYKRLEFPLKNPNNFKVVDCLNGVVCLSDFEDDNMVLWNPSIKKLLELPKPLVPLNHTLFFRCIGFGFDAATNDFKVVRTLHPWQSKAPEHVEVYESSVGLWRRIKRDTDWSSSGRVSSISTNQAFLNGVVHWIGAGTNKGIVLFDFQNEVLGRMDVPAYFLAPMRYFARNLGVSVMRGESLSLIHHHKLSDPEETCSIWVMKEYGVADSWTKLYNVSIPNSTRGIKWFAIISTRWNGEVLMNKSDEAWLYSYVPDTKLVKRLKLFDTSYVFNFTGSLALLGVNGVKHAMETHSEVADMKHGKRLSKLRREEILNRRLTGLFRNL